MPGPFPVPRTFKGKALGTRLLTYWNAKKTHEIALEIPTVRKLGLRSAQFDFEMFVPNEFPVRNVNENSKHNIMGRSF